MPTFSGYSFNLVSLPYTFPTSGNAIMNNSSGLTFGTDKINELGLTGRGFYFNSFDSDGVDRTAYFESFLNQGVTISFTQDGNTAIYSGDTQSFKSWSFTSSGTGFVFGSNIGVPPSNSPSGQATIIQSSPTDFNFGELVYIDLGGIEIVTPTPTNTQTPTNTPTITNTPTPTETPTPTNTQTPTTTTTTQTPTTILNISVSYNNQVTTSKTLESHNFGFYEGWSPSPTFSGYSYSFGQAPVGFTLSTSYQTLGSTGSESFTVSIFTYSNDTFAIFASTSQQRKGLSSADALRVTRNFTGLATFSNIQKSAADVSSNGTINSTDALRIQQRFVGQITKFPKGDWVLTPITFSISQLFFTQSQYFLSITISCVGDVA
jgi:hypothetical protein